LGKSILQLRDKTQNSYSDLTTKPVFNAEQTGAGRTKKLGVFQGRNRKHRTLVLRKNKLQHHIELMMRNDINVIFNNGIGIAFLWKIHTPQKSGKIQLLFRDTALLLNKKELIEFSKQIKKTIKTQPLCSDCEQKENYLALLLETPFPQLIFAISNAELSAEEELVDGTLFQLNLDGYLNTIFRD
jgi:hypothetical protein